MTEGHKDDATFLYLFIFVCVNVILNLCMQAVA